MSATVKPKKQAKRMETSSFTSSLIFEKRRRCEAHEISVSVFTDERTFHSSEIRFALSETTFALFFESKIPGSQTTESKQRNRSNNWYNDDRGGVIWD